MIILKDKFRKIVPDYIINPDYNSIKSGIREIKEFDYKRVIILNRNKFHDRTEYIIYKVLFKAAAFYIDLVINSE